MMTPERQALPGRKTRTVYDDLREAITLRGPERRGVLHLIDAIERGDREREAEVKRMREIAEYHGGEIDRLRGLLETRGTSDEETR